MYHLLTSDDIDSEDTFSTRFKQEVVPAGAETDRAIEVAELICEGAPLAVQATKASSLIYATEGEAACIAAFGPKQAELANTEDAAEGIASFIERRKGNFVGR